MTKLPNARARERRRRFDHDCVSRQEVIETIDTRQTEFDEQTDKLEKDADDVETTRETIDELELTGTSETSEAVERALDAAENISEEEFNEDGEQLDQTQDQTHEYEGDLRGRSDTTEADLGKVSDASGRLNSDRPNREWIEAKEELIRDKEFLDEQEQRARDAREESERIQQVLDSRLQATRGP
jgi:hypothetical protein